MGKIMRLRLTRPRNLAGLLAALAVAAGVAGPGQLPWIGAGSSSGAPPAAVHVSEDLQELLARVEVVDRIDDVPGYDRSCRKNHGCVFGPAWNDPSLRTGCDRRNTTLAASMRDVKFKPGTRNCKVISGVLDDPFTGMTIAFSTDDPGAVPLDHLIPLSLAWDAGAHSWTRERRVQFANDPSNLTAVSRKANAAKSDSSLGEWLPPNTAYRCEYSRRYLAVSSAYDLPITTADRDTAIRACAAEQPDGSQ